MSIENDPGRNELQGGPSRYNAPKADGNRRNVIYLGGIVALALVVGGIVWATSNNTSTIADRPATSTGQGGGQSPAPANR